MEGLPDEILFEMFDYLNGKQILQMFLVSKRINEVVSSDCRLMEKIKLKLDFNKIRKSCYTRSAKKAKLLDSYDLFQSKRNYQVLEIYKMIDMPEALKIFEKFQNIKKLVFNNCEFHGQVSSCLRTILDIWKTSLQEIDFYFVDFASEDEISECEPFEFDRLRKVSIWYSNPEYLEIFTNSKLQKLEIAPSFFSSNKSTDIFINLMNAQDNLKHLKMHSCYRIFMKTDLSAVKFQLESMEYFGLYHEEAENNFLDFLKSQGKLLKCLTRKGCCSESCCYIILNMPNLKTLKLFSFNDGEQNELNFRSFPTNYSIENCSIHLTSHNDDCMQSVIKFMKNLQYLNLRRGNVKYLFEADLKYLKFLSLDDCIVDESLLNQETGAFASLKRLSLLDTSWNLARHLIIKNPQLTNLTVSRELRLQAENLISSESLNNLEIQILP